MTHWETVWSFETANYEVLGQVSDCTDDPADHFEFPEDIDAVRDGKVYWFDARVIVKKNGHTVGSDYLGGCSYASIEEFFASHRDRDPSNRNTLALKATNTVICHYFPSMVAEAIADARRTIG
jgi:hypothetical protein